LTVSSLAILILSAHKKVPQRKEEKLYTPLSVEMYGLGGDEKRKEKVEKF
jgi:hypothetical protein